MLLVPLLALIVATIFDFRQRQIFCAAIAGGLLAVVALLRGKRDLAYTPALALGLLVFMMIRGMR